MMSTREDRLYHQKDLALAIEMGRRASLALDNAQLYLDLKRKEENLNEAVRARDEFLSIASHELRTPLTPLKMQLQGLARLLTKNNLTGADKTKAVRMAEMSHQQVDRLVSLVDDLLDATRISTGRLELRYQEVAPVNLIREVCDRYMDEKIRCYINLDPATKASWDRLRVEQVLVNLISNAIKYAPHQIIDVEMKAESGDVIVSVKDRGPGIREEDQMRIFERYERVESSHGLPGLGLGLYISKQIIEAHGGRIWVESKPGRGSTFFFRVPLKILNKPLGAP